jgi:hypothetical protein
MRNTRWALERAGRRGACAEIDARAVHIFCAANL